MRFSQDMKELWSVLESTYITNQTKVLWTVQSIQLIGESLGIKEKITWMACCPFSSVIHGKNSPESLQNSLKTAGKGS